MKISDMCSTEGRLGAYLNTMVADLEIDGKGQYLRELFGKFYSEVCAAEAGSKLAKQSTNTTKCAMLKYHRKMGLIGIKECGSCGGQLR